jgi:hypothetical protein
VQNDGKIVECFQQLGCSATPKKNLALFEEKEAELSATIQNTFENQGRVVQQVGKVTDAWIRLESQIQMEMLIRERIKTP